MKGIDMSTLYRIDNLDKDCTEDLAGAAEALYEGDR